MKLRNIALILIIISITTVINANRVVLKNESGKTVTYRTNLQPTGKTLINGDFAELGDIPKTLTSLEIKELAYSSLNSHLQELKLEQRSPFNRNKFAIIYINKTDPRRSWAWNVSTAWLKSDK